MPFVRRSFGIALAVTALFAVTPCLAHAAEVNGIWTEASTKDLGEWTGVQWLKKIKIRGWFESAFVHNTNTPSRTTVNATQGSSVVKAHDTTIEGRTFDKIGRAHV